MQKLLSAIPGEEKKILTRFKEQIKNGELKAPNGLDELTALWVDKLLEGY